MPITLGGKTVVAPIYQADVYQQSATCPLYPSTKDLARVNLNSPSRLLAIYHQEPHLTQRAEIDAALGHTRLAGIDQKPLPYAQ